MRRTATCGRSVLRDRSIIAAYRREMPRSLSQTTSGAIDAHGAPNGPELDTHGGPSHRGKSGWAITRSTTARGPRRMCHERHVDAQCYGRRG